MFHDATAGPGARLAVRLGASLAERATVLALHVAIASLLVAGLIALSELLGERHAEPGTGRPFESGVEPTGSARVRVGASFHRVAILFVIFDVESVFFLAWAVSARSTGWAGLAEAAVFAGVLLLALVYLTRTGALSTAEG
jgi:NADH-quinone oxidoreductase subunit A